MTNPTFSQALDHGAPPALLETIKQAITAHEKILADVLRKRFRVPGSWKLHRLDLPVGETGDQIDVVFSHSEENDQRFVLIDLSIPHLHIGQKFTLDGKAKVFQKEVGIPALRLKKAILLIRKGTETISTTGSRLRVPIIEIQLEDLLGSLPKVPFPEQSEEKCEPAPVPSSPEPASEPTRSSSQRRKGTKVRQAVLPLDETTFADMVPATPAPVPEVPSPEPPSTLSATEAPPPLVPPEIPLPPTTPDPIPLAAPATPAAPALLDQNLPPSFPIATVNSQPENSSPNLPPSSIQGAPAPEVTPDPGQAVTPAPRPTPAAKQPPPRDPRPETARAENPPPPLPHPQSPSAPPGPPRRQEPLPPELLAALREAIVTECLATMHKRRNKYIRKGLWKWIEKEILDANAHFFLIMLSSIYQGKSSEVLSRRFKTGEDFVRSVDAVIDAIFHAETSLASEILKQEERHRKALRKFLECFSQTPPCEYLRSLFLKEFRSSTDGLRARLTVFDTMRQLLQRCGFQGEKETQYPMEILDELGIFQGYMLGNYAQLRVENAAKKLAHLVPQRNWPADEVYRLREDLARVLHLPASEFNLNAFLPQAFAHDAQHLAAKSREGTARPLPGPLPSQPTHRPQTPSMPPIPQGRAPQPRPSHSPRPGGPPEPRQPAPPPQRHQAAKPSEFVDQHQPRRPHAPSPRPEAPMVSPAGESSVGVPAESAKNLSALLTSPPPTAQVSRLLSARAASPELDEARHRFFEDFGGGQPDDGELLTLLDDLSQQSSRTCSPQADVAPVPNSPADLSEEEDLAHMPTRSSLAGHSGPGMPARLAVDPDMPPPRKRRIGNNNKKRRKKKQGKRRTDGRSPHPYHSGGPRPPRPPHSPQ
jgi:hypothetical protein